MKLPRNLSGEDLVKALKNLGYQTTRQAGSHVRLTTQQMGEHHVTIPNHSFLRIGTLSSILSSVAEHFKISRSEIFEKIFGRIK